MTKNQPSIDNRLLARKFEDARSSMMQWKDHDDGSEFSVFNLYMIDNRTNTGVACIIEYDGEDKPAGRAGFIAVTKQYAPLFSGAHLILDYIPPDGKWDFVHGRNVSDFRRLMKRIYESDSDNNTKASEMLAVRRQLLMYKMIFPEAHGASDISNEERLLATDAVLMNKLGGNVDALRSYISHCDRKAEKDNDDVRD
jgi:hypothetical protein